MMINSDVMLLDLMLRVSTLEKILIDKNIISKEEYKEEIEKMSEKAAQIILEKSKK